MTSAELRLSYFEWITQLVCNSRYLGCGISDYGLLLRHLFEREFQSMLIKDENRRKDGVALRYRFSYEYSYGDSFLEQSLWNDPCSILEMMVALALRCEESIMYDPDIGNRLPIWFWSMVSSLGLGYMSDSAYDEQYVDQVLTRFINREYEPDGRGGLFIIPNCPRDLRKVEIWTQASWFFDTILGEKE